MAAINAQANGSRRGARLTAAFRDFDSKRTGRIDRTFLEALIHLSVSRELTSAEARQLTEHLDHITDPHENVDYEAFVGWLYGGASRLPELVLSPGSNTGASRPLSGRTLRNVVRHKLHQEQELATREATRSAAESAATARPASERTNYTPGDGYKAGMGPPRSAPHWPSVGSARCSRLTSPELAGMAMVHTPRTPSTEPRRDFPGSRARSVQGRRPRALGPMGEDPEAQSRTISRMGAREEQTKSPALPAELRARQLRAKARARTAMDCQEQQTRRSEVIETSRRQQEVQQHRYYQEKLERSAREGDRRVADEELVDEVVSAKAPRVGTTETAAPVRAVPRAGHVDAGHVAAEYEERLQRELQRQQELELWLREEEDPHNWLQQQRAQRQREEDELAGRRRQEQNARQVMVDETWKQRQRYVDDLRGLAWKQKGPGRAVEQETRTE